MKPFYQHVVMLVALLAITLTQAQGFVPGQPGTTPPFNPNAPTGGGNTPAPNDPLAGAGGALDALIGLANGGSILDFACQTATAVNGAEQTGTSQDAQDIICSITSMFTEVEDLLEINNTTMEESQALFAKSTLFGLNVGNLISGNPGQLQGISKRLDDILTERNPSRMTEMGREMAEYSAVTEARNYEVAAPGSVQGDFNEAMKWNPQLGMAHVAGLYQQANITTQTIENMAALEGSRGIAQALSESTAPDQLVEAISLGKDNKGVAPALRDEATTAVSTRATVQTVVEAISYYMEQDVRQFAYLSEQLTLQSQQQVYTGKMLQISANAILAEQKQKNDQSRAKLEAAVNEVTVRVNDSAEKVTTMARAFAEVGNPEVTPLEFNLNRLTTGW